LRQVDIQSPTLSQPGLSGYPFFSSLANNVSLRGRSQAPAQAQGKAEG